MSIKNWIRTRVWQFLGAAPTEPGAIKKIDTHHWRREAIDMAVMNIKICIRGEQGAGGEEPDTADLLSGDYAEFGVFRGTSFIHTFHRASTLIPSMRFFAFDSFNGLPAINGPDEGGEFHEGQFACSRDEFESELRLNGVDMDRVIVCDGWFNESLTEEFRKSHKLRTVSLAFIDCDLYESCVPVLEFLTPLLRQGSILLFDDWLNFRGDVNKGVQRATSEWLMTNSDLSLTPWVYFCHHGRAFIVNRNGSGKKQENSSTSHMSVG